MFKAAFRQTTNLNIKRVMSTNTKSLPSRQPTSEEKVIIDEILSLYQCRPTDKSYSHYKETAVFSDPVSSRHTTVSL